MGGVCSFGADSINKGEILTEDGKIIVQKRQNLPHDVKDNKFYEETADHKALEPVISRKKNSMRYTTKQYPNGSTKVILF